MQWKLSTVPKFRCPEPTLNPVSCGHFGAICCHPEGRAVRGPKDLSLMDAPEEFDASRRAIQKPRGSQLQCEE